MLKTCPNLMCFLPNQMGDFSMIYTLCWECLEMKALSLDLHTLQVRTRQLMGYPELAALANLF